MVRMAGVASRGPLPNPNRRRRNKPPSSGRHVLIARPSLPQALSAEAKAEWRRIVPELENMGVLTKTDRALLIRYCTVWADWVDINAAIAKSSKLIMGDHGLIRNPLWRLRSDCETALDGLMKALVLSPNARLRAAIQHDRAEPEQDENAPTIIDVYRQMLAEKQ